MLNNLARVCLTAHVLSNKQNIKLYKLENEYNYQHTR